MNSDELGTRAKEKYRKKKKIKKEEDDLQEGLDLT